MPWVIKLSLSLYSETDYRVLTFLFAVLPVTLGNYQK